MSTIASGIALASSLVVSAMPAEVSLEEFVAQQIKQEVVLVQNNFVNQLKNDVANTTYQFSLEENVSRGTVTINEAEISSAE